MPGASTCYEALSKGYAEIINLLLEYEPDHFGRCDGSTNADGSFYSRMLGKRNKLSNYFKEAIKDLEDIIFYAENAVDILTVIKDSNNVDDAREALMQKYELPAHKVNKIMRLRLAMFTKNDVNKLKDRRDEYIEHVTKNKQAQEEDN
ncbi:hypothetical protein J1C67_00025 [Clostridium gasigenes]|uniref:DNA gyrase subunit A n=1 Tax=Clostridium gasigenes TaxID=94869 RepID=UPI0014386D1A|nr:DNA gyrase subunit A [Clostridium gasigenes]NKF07116.1 hypothetical protein [Clostridium gasigenes]QSW19633.1 hypothetical protein J1C67_00025 [Clostridium gasigenes]